LTFALASLYLLEETFLNYRHAGTYSVDCSEVLKPWKFVNGSLWGLLSVVLGILYYHSISSTKNMNQMGNPGNANNHGSIAMTQPQVPAQMTLQEPVFVPEDTYNRRQMV
ncbi:hypothetical protein MKW94_018780, partial [Papaver nudicaule]|nr:hypothetical protein [Papaver nudicaule]